MVDVDNDGPPPPLPLGWVRRISLSRPGYVYYFHQDTGECRWQLAAAENKDSPSHPLGTTINSSLEVDKSIISGNATSQLQHTENSSNKEEEEDLNGNDVDRPKKRPRAEESADRRLPPKEVRVLHILKKHKDCRRPSSWRQATIDCTKEQATNDVRELLDILQEVQHDSTELRATFEELARSESDCSSAKRGGDLGFFGRKKMQPAFESASFALDVGQLSGIVDTNSGVHIILRIE
eukprot:CAMPEP_0172423834 /NCGR_PEP_ID=MMETSP1064-20121228/17765_1 /TAXON_ID=202472 /ORGANISM="Aulacoseira subarctica , Strain CCAP 1002/5" /LENGTH=236 /DNA_ID=CAMNT_0013165381 /DNA_START=23 /DNA_END=733 /DNA_ORIENTATION=-